MDAMIAIATADLASKHGVDGEAAIDRWESAGGMNANLGAAVRLSVALLFGAQFQQQQFLSVAAER